MGLEDFTPVESSEGWSNSAEISEKFKESVKRSSAGIKRTQKDEKKAKKYDFLLAKFLVKIILEKKYDVILDNLFLCLEKGYATNFLMGILSLVYMPISAEIRLQAKKEEITFSYNPKNPSEPFHDTFMDDVLRKRINQWIEDIDDVITLEPSSVTSNTTLQLLQHDTSIVDFTSKIFVFFLFELWIIISEKKARSYSEFILWELEKTFKSLQLEQI